MRRQALSGDLGFCLCWVVWVELLSHSRTFFFYKVKGLGRLLVFKLCSFGSVRGFHTCLPPPSNLAVFAIVMKTLVQICVTPNFNTLENTNVLSWLCINYSQSKNKGT